MRWCMSQNSGKSTSVRDARRCRKASVLARDWLESVNPNNSSKSQSSIDCRWYIKRFSLWSGCFYRCAMKINENEQDNDGRTNLALHPDKQFWNPAGWIDDLLKYFLEEFGDVRWACQRSMMNLKAKIHIKAIEVREKFRIWSRFQAMFR